MNQKQYDQFVDTILTTIIEQVTSLGWNDSVENTGILIKSAEIVGEFWDLEMQVYDRLLQLVGDLREDFE